MPADPMLAAVTGGIAALLIGAAILAVVRYALAQKSTRNTAVTGEWSAMAGQVSELAGRLSQVVEGQSHLVRQLDDRLDKVSVRMGQSLEQSAEKTAKTMAALQERLVLIDQAQKNITELSGQVVELQDILANKQARGAFGEIQMGDIVRAALPPQAYEFQKTLSNNRRADCLIRLPNPPGPIVIDAKFPLESYAALQKATDEAGRRPAERAFRDDVLKHVTAIAERYIVPGETAESALMFLPSEAVYAEIHAHFRDIVEKSYQKRVWIVSPTTLMATLNTVRAVLKDARMREQAHVIQKEVLLLIEDVARLQDRVANLRRHFGQAEEDIRKIDTSADKIVRRAERIEEVQMEDAPDSLPVTEPANVQSLYPKTGEQG